MRKHLNPRLITYYSLFANGVFFLPILLPFYKEHIGIGYQGMMIGEGAFAAACVIFNVPAGWVSDIWKRKYTLVLGALFQGIGIGIYLFASALWHVVGAETVIALGYCLFASAQSAMLYDSLLNLNRQGEYRKWEGRRLAFALYGVAVTATIGGFVYPHYNYLPFLLSMASQGLGIVAACLMHEPHRHKKPREKHPLIDMLDTIKYVVYGHSEIGILIVPAAIFLSATKLISWTQPAYFMALGVPVSWYGILIAAGFLLGGQSSHWSHLFNREASVFRILAGAWMAALAVCAGAGIYLGYAGIGLLMFGGSFLYGFVVPRVSEYINQAIGSERRATILSTLSLLASLLYIPSSPLIGWVADKWNIQTGLFVIAFWLVVTGIGLSLVRRRRLTA